MSSLTKIMARSWGIVFGLILATTSFAFEAQVFESANQTERISHDVQLRTVKIYGAGGLGSLESYQSGFFVSDQGHIVTSWSTVLDVSVVHVVTADGVRHDTQIVGSDPQTELAVLKIELEANEHFPLQSAVEASPGMRVLAISNLFGIAQGREYSSVQKGVVMAVTKLSARRGAFKTLYQGQIIVLDVMTNNPGATGGALVDLDGQLVGMLGKELRDEQAGIYMNYALPANVLASSVERILSGEVILAKRDGDMEPVADPHTTDGIGIVLVPNVLPKTPPFIDQVVADSVAARSGLQANDLVLLVNSQRIDSQKTLREVLASLNRNDAYTMLVQRGQELVQIDVVP